MPYCWKCKAPYTAMKKMPGFHDTCDTCHNYWHSCCNCQHFTGYPTARCLLPDTDAVHDFEGANFCDEFKLAETPPGQRNAPGPDDARKRWNDLFKD